MEIFKCDDCDKLFRADDLELYEEYYGRICRKYMGCPYCGSRDFYESKLPYEDFCGDYPYCDFECETCNVTKGQNNPICKEYEYCDFICERCPLHQSGEVE